jgi:hypothetical protein
VTLFAITVDKINREITNRQVIDVLTEVTDKELINRKLPPKYRDLSNVFL